MKMNIDLTRCVKIDGDDYFYDEKLEQIYFVRTEFIPVDIKPEIIHLIKKILEITGI